MVHEKYAFQIVSNDKVLWHVGMNIEGMRTLKEAVDHVIADKCEEGEVGLVMLNVKLDNDEVGQSEGPQKTAYELLQQTNKN